MTDHKVGLTETVPLAEELSVIHATRFAIKGPNNPDFVDILTVRFTRGQEVLEVSLHVGGPETISWIHSGSEPDSREESKSDICWAHGRLTRIGPNSTAFYKVMLSMGLTFGQIEAEFREMTGYEDGDD